jgi:hypothetical protein
MDKKECSIWHVVFFGMWIYKKDPASDSRELQRGLRARFRLLGSFIPKMATGLDVPYLHYIDREPDRIHLYIATKQP